MTVRVACCQIAPDVDDPGRNAAVAEQAIDSAVAGGAQIIVLPELANSGYVFRSADEARAAAVCADDELLRRWGSCAARGDALLVAGFSELTAGGSLANSVALLDGTTVLAVYRKLHLWSDERRWFAPGDRPAPVVGTRYGRIGLAICYDIEFPELTRGLALEGAELIAIPANWPHAAAPPDGRPVLHSLASMTAYWNRVFVAVCDRCRSERGCEFEGGSVVAGPDGSLRAGPVLDRGTETLFGDCDLDEARDKRTSDGNDAFADRRAECYSGVLLER